MHIPYRDRLRSIIFALDAALGLSVCGTQALPDDETPNIANPDADQAFIKCETSEFNVKLTKNSQTLAALLLKGGEGFDFAPGDRLAQRGANGFYHLGDLTLRLRSGAAGEWRDYDTAASRQPVTPLPPSDKILAADLAPTLPPDCPLGITRTWTVEDNRLVLRFDLTNRSAQPVEIGGLDLPMVFDNIITGRSLEQAHAACSFSDPYMGMDAGYLQVTRLSGHGPALVVAPLEKTPFEAYRPLDEPMPRGQTFEGMLAWTVHDKAYAEREWRNAQQWNPPTSETLAPGQTRVCGVKFLLAPEIRDIEKTLTANARPVAVGVPGYVLPTDLDARLFLKYGAEVDSITADPADAIAILREPSNAAAGWQAYTLRGQTWGRARLDIAYKDGTRQTVHYCVIKPAAQAVAELGHFLTTKQWFDDPADPFKRSPSIISYDREADRPVTQERRVWIAGLSDEGAGSWVAAAMKEFGQPAAEKVAKFERFVDEVLWGTIQYKEGDRKWGVRKSAFFHQPD